jgi:hypothetical protein
MLRLIDKVKPTGTKMRHEKRGRAR